MQIKRVNARAEYLLKILKKQIDLKLGVTRVRKPRKPKEVKTTVTKEIVEDNDSSNDENKKLQSKIDKSAIKKEEEVKEDTDDSEDKKKEKKIKKERENKKMKNKQATGSMHFPANNEPKSVNVMGELEDAVFQECKEMMRPVKKALKALDMPDMSLRESERAARVGCYLHQIGDHITECLEQYKNPEEFNEWKTNLWYFVSNFTNFKPKKLYKVYRSLVRKKNSENNGASTSLDKKDESTIMKRPKHVQQENKKRQEDSNDNKAKKRKLDEVTNISTVIPPVVPNNPKEYKKQEQDRYDRKYKRDGGYGRNGREDYWLSREGRDNRFHKRFHSYRTSGSYHGHRDRDYMKEKQNDYYRYSSGPPSYGYGPAAAYGGSSSTYSSADISSSHFRGRNYSSDNYSNDWRSNKEYRRDYDRRLPPSNS